MLQLTLPYFCIQGCIIACNHLDVSFLEIREEPDVPVSNATAIAVGATLSACVFVLIAVAVLVIR